MSNIATLILAAGRSSRMGQPKQLLPWGTSFLLDDIIKTLSQIPQGKIIVVLGSNYGMIESKIKHHSIDIVYNADYNKGMGSSISTGLSAIQKLCNDCEGVMIALADQPLIPVLHYTTVIETFSKGKKQIIASAYESKRLGVPALFDRHYFKHLIDLDGDRGAKSIIKQNRDNVIAIDAKDYMADLDTLEDYNSLYKANHQ
ncbi:nucleotidyltransferase family protein [Hanstruepera marina]|uniref:nucleotidyltransferase family protein n=1 Tax=Hanstruepera marina TaxID=2873265 RepID=UPI001CA65BEC|nr:nucleotidyltransferase family protein [Hanstruepera marina]